jgi:hypothetical protein
VTVRATMPDGRQDEDDGAAPIGTLKGEALANAMMKATTKAKNRATLSICGLAMLDVSELESLPGVDVSGGAESPENPYQTHMDEQKALHEALEKAPEDPRPFVESTHAPDVSTGAHAPAAPGASGMAPSASTKAPLLTKPQLLTALEGEFKRLADQSTGVALSKKVFGEAIDTWDKVKQLPAGSLRNGLAKMQAIATQQPPADPTPGGAEEDVPNHPPPADVPAASPGPTPDVADASNGDRPAQCETVSKTGIRCARLQHDFGEHYFDPGRPEARPVKLADAEHVIVVPDPDTGVRYVSTSDGMALREWFAQHEQMSFYAAAVAKNDRNHHGNIMMPEAQYWQIRRAGEALVEMPA